MVPHTSKSWHAGSVVPVRRRASTRVPGRRERRCPAQVSERVQPGVGGPPRSRFGPSRRTSIAGTHPRTPIFARRERLTKPLALRHTRDRPLKRTLHRCKRQEPEEGKPVGRVFARQSHLGAWSAVGLSSSAMSLRHPGGPPQAPHSQNGVGGAGLGQAFNATDHGNRTAAVAAPPAGTFTTRLFRPCSAWTKTTV